jgi:8-oxo-dGTP pyrophosphatase MutT (NUDIX family)
MQFSRFLSILSELEAHSLPGPESHHKMIPKVRIIPSQEEIEQANPAQAAVLALFFPDRNEETHFLLTLRANYPGAHSAQISFPGGKYEPMDGSLERTALRETEEETGVPSEKITIHRALSETYIPPSNFLVRPYLGLVMKRPLFKPNHEVEQIIQVRLSDLLSETALGSKNLTTSYMKNVDVPCFHLNQHVVWGATAMMLSEIKDLIKLTYR